MTGGPCYVRKEKIHRARDRGVRGSGGRRGKGTEDIAVIPDTTVHVGRKTVQIQIGGVIKKNESEGDGNRGRKTDRET